MAAGNMVAALVDSADSRQLRWLLHTQDGHPFYRRFGFGHPDPTVMQRGPDPSAAWGSS